MGRENKVRLYAQIKSLIGWRKNECADKSWHKNWRNHSCNVNDAYLPACNCIHKTRTLQTVVNQIYQDEKKKNEEKLKWNCISSAFSVLSVPTWNLIWIISMAVLLSQINCRPNDCIMETMMLGFCGTTSKLTFFVVVTKFITLNMH